MQKEDFIHLIDKYLDGTATPSERLLVEEYYNRLAAMEPASYFQSAKKHEPELLSAMAPAKWSTNAAMTLTMFKSHFKIGYRNLLKSKVFSFINIFGLATGMAACFFIFQYIRFELSYDQWHKNADRLYRVPICWSNPFSDIHASANCYPAVGPAMKADFLEVVDFARIAPSSVFTKTTQMSYTDEKGETKRFNEQKIYLADASFLSLFSFPFVTGDAATSLVKPNSIVISETMARKYFGNDSPMDKILCLNDRHLKVTGIFKDVPDNSHIRFDMLISLSSRGVKFGYTDWSSPSYYNYVLLAPGADPKKVEARFSAFIDKYLGAKRKELNIPFQFRLQPVTDIHLKSDYDEEAEPNGSEKMLYFLSILGVFILVIAWINYINLSTAKSMGRAREVGVRKAAGAASMQLSGQFIVESLLINAIALLLSVSIVIVAAPYFDEFVGKHISKVSLSAGLLHEWKFWLILLIVFAAGALQVGAYPAFILSAFRPALALKGIFHLSDRGVFLRKSLVTFQFVLSTLLIAGTIIVYKQLSFMRNQDLGYDKDQLLVVKAPAIQDCSFDARTDYFKAKLLEDPAINYMGPSSEIPGNKISDNNQVRRSGLDRTHGESSYLLEIDKDFIATYQMNLVCGSNLPDHEAGNVFETRHTKVMINETLVKKLGFKNNEAALHQDILLISWFGDIKCEITGVVKNYHQRSLRESYEPILYYHNSRSNWGYFSINVNSKDLHRQVAYIESLYKKIFPGNTFESFFLNVYFNRQYQADQRFGNIFGLFTILAIVIACLGLIGLSTFEIKLRTKEIGIRKVLGASISGIVVLFSGDFVKLVFLAVAIAVPIIYFMGDKWLSNYAFHTHLNWSDFVLPPLLLLMIALFTVSVQSTKAAIANPVKSLRGD